mmetsp:Transcript_11980/g.24351  ORF Transcript_11980/g.24351 Transcript_11980/m.24351 type:complete len:260 (-) Transcript_11980:550-1329(-)
MDLRQDALRRRRPQAPAPRRAHATHQWAADAGELGRCPQRGGRRLGRRARRASGRLRGSAGGGGGARVPQGASQLAREHLHHFHRRRRPVRRLAAGVPRQHVPRWHRGGGRVAHGRHQPARRGSAAQRAAAAHGDARRPSRRHRRPQSRAHLRVPALGPRRRRACRPRQRQRALRLHSPGRLAARATHRAGCTAWRRRRQRGRPHTPDRNLHRRGDRRLERLLRAPAHRLGRGGARRGLRPGPLGRAPRGAQGGLLAGR